MAEEIVFDLSRLFSGTAKLKDLESYIEGMSRIDADGKWVVLIGGAPVRLYLKAVHHLHGRAKKLYYESHNVGKVLVFDHDPD